MDFDGECGSLSLAKTSPGGARHAWRLIKWLFRLVVTLAMVGAAVVGWLFWRAMPTMSGTEKLAGLSADVRVWRDAYAVPHIFAANMDDAARALGYLHASERLFQMEVNRRVGQGRAAETFGADLLKVDKFLRTLGFYREAKASFAALSPEAQKRLQAYADGVNAFLDEPSERPAARVPARRRPAGAVEAGRFVVWFKLMALELAQKPRSGGVARPYRAKARTRQSVAGFSPA